MADVEAMTLEHLWIAKSRSAATTDMYGSTQQDSKCAQVP